MNFRRGLSRIAIIALVSSGAVACLPIPHTHVRQPATTFRVEDLAGAPLEAATVRLYAGIVVSRRIRDSAVVVTDARGVAVIPRRREVHPVYVLAVDGEAPWRWAFCVSAPGHRAEAGEIDSEPTAPIRVRLSRVDSSVSGADSGATVTVEVCPAAPRRLDDVLRPAP